MGSRGRQAQRVTQLAVLGDPAFMAGDRTLFTPCVLSLHSPTSTPVTVLGFCLFSGRGSFGRRHLRLGRYSPTLHHSAGPPPLLPVFAMSWRGMWVTQPGGMTPEHRGSEERVNRLDFKASQVSAQHLPPPPSARAQGQRKR